MTQAQERTRVWRRLPVFIASAFRDMDRERDQVAQWVMPQVNQRLADLGLGCEVYHVDLRWGLTTDDKLSPQDRLRSILNTCLEEVARCQPLFVGFLAEGLGAPVDRVLVDPVLERHALTAPPVPLSVTSLEILGATASAARRGDDVTPIVFRRQRVGTAPETDVDVFAAHLASLGTVTLSYTDEHDGLVVMGAALVDRLVSAVQRIVGARPAADWLQLELDRQALSAAAALETFVGREAERQMLAAAWSLSPIDDLDPIGDAPPQVLASKFGTNHRNISVVAGSSGIGKSALLSAMASEPPHTDDLFNNPGIPRPVALLSVGRSPHSHELPVALLILIAQVDATKADQIAERTTPANITIADVLPTWLELLDPTARHFVAKIIVDGIDDLVDGERPARTSDWLPVRLPTHSRVLLSARDNGIELPALRRRLDVRVVELDDLTPGDATELIRSRLVRGHKTASPALVHRLSRRSRNPRWLVVASQLMLTLNRHDYLLLSSANLTGLDPEKGSGSGASRSHRRPRPFNRRALRRGLRPVNRLLPDSGPRTGSAGHQLVRAPRRRHHRSDESGDAAR